jgi:hypothetical protein
MPFFTCCCSSKTNASAMPWLPEWYFTAVEEGAKEETESDGTGGVKEWNRWGQQWMGDQVCVLLWPRPALLWRRRGSTEHCHFPCSASRSLHPKGPKACGSSRSLLTLKDQKHVALHVRSFSSASRTKSMWLFVLSGPPKFWCLYPRPERTVFVALSDAWLTAGFPWPYHWPRASLFASQVTLGRTGESSQRFWEACQRMERSFAGN